MRYIEVLSDAKACQRLKDGNAVDTSVAKPQGLLEHLGCCACLQGLLSCLPQSVPDPIGYSTLIQLQIQRLCAHWFLFSELNPSTSSIHTDHVLPFGRIERKSKRKGCLMHFGAQDLQTILQQQLGELEVLILQHLHQPGHATVSGCQAGC